jgi:AcrR family transcriptional regulator
MKKATANQRRGRPITRNREQVLEAAMKAYWQDDRAAVSVNALCAMASVSKPSLYRDFGSEDGLTAAVLERYKQTVMVFLEALLSGPQSYGAKLDSLVSFACDDPQMEMGCLFTKMLATRSRFGPQTQALLDSIQAHFRAHFARFFNDAARRGEWRGGIATDLAASYLQEQIGLALAQRAAGKSPASIRALFELTVSVLRREDVSPPWN